MHLVRERKGSGSKGIEEYKNKEAVELQCLQFGNIKMNNTWDDAMEKEDQYNN